MDLVCTCLLEYSVLVPQRNKENASRYRYRMLSVTDDRTAFFAIGRYLAKDYHCLLPEIIIICRARVYVIHAC